LARTPSSHGYWEAARDGAVFSFGDARFFGSMGGVRLNQPIVGIAAARSGRGYWLVASDGGVFTFGDARFLGNAVATAGSIVGLAALQNGDGYWMADALGHVFAFGHAPALGDSPATALGFTRPVVGIVATGDGVGYWLVRRGTAAVLPGPVTVISAGHGGGSGEIQLNWNAVAGANGYQVSRATSVGGPFSVTADINVTTGKTTTNGLPIDTPGSVINIHSFRQGYFPLSTATPVPTPPSRYFQYTDIATLTGPSSYYTVTAYNAAGAGPASVVVCGSPVGYPVPVC
jgi:hypothetical protein